MQSKCIRFLVIELFVRESKHNENVRIYLAWAWDKENLTNTHSDCEQLGNRSILNVRSSSTPFQIRRRVTEGWRGEGLKTAKGEKVARALTLSSGSHPPGFPDRKKNDERGEEKRMIKGKHEWIYKPGVARKRRAAWATPLQRLACRSKLPICCVGCCPDQLPAVITCVCVIRQYTGTCTYTSASCAWQPGIRTERRICIWRILPCGCQR